MLEFQTVPQLPCSFLSRKEALFTKRGHQRAIADFDAEEIRRKRCIFVRPTFASLDVDVSRTQIQRQNMRLFLRGVAKKPITPYRERFCLN